MRKEARSVGMKEHFRRFARYNQWANRLLYAAVGTLTADAFQAPRSGFFGSLCGTLNHLYVADRSWLARFEGTAAPHRTLDEQPHKLFPHLQAGREVEDARIIRLMDEATPGWLGGMLQYKRMVDGQDASMPMELALVHFFNHQTHHRGQAHGMLSATGVAPPSLDFASFLSDEKSAG
jgi:uncharacterized damage-inducible protein DinB